jgi:hypothetical protein
MLIDTSLLGWRYSGGYAMQIQRGSGENGMWERIGHLLQGRSATCSHLTAMRDNSKWFLVIVALTAVHAMLSSCDPEPKAVAVFESSRLFSHKLVLVDSLVYRNLSEEYITETRDVMSWRGKILISDMYSMKVWVFDSTLSLLTTIGRKGKGPSEFAKAPYICRDETRLWLVDLTLHRVAMYDTNLTYQGSRALPRNYYFDPGGGARCGEWVILRGHVFDDVLRSPRDLKKYPPLVAFDSMLAPRKAFWEWDRDYFDETREAFALTYQKVRLCSNGTGGFFAHQSGTHRLTEFSKDLNPIRTFGVLPLFWKPIPNVTFASTQRSFEAAAEFMGSVTTILRMDYEKVNHHVIVNYVNLDKDFAFQRSMLVGQHYVQIYDSTMSCIFDGPVPGMLAFTLPGKVFFLTDERPEFLKFKAFRVERIPH